MLGRPIYGGRVWLLVSVLAGSPAAVILLRHLLPNSFPTLIVVYTINLGNGVLTEPTLSYLGIGDGLRDALDPRLRGKL